MIDELIENVEAYLRLNAIGDMSDRLTLDYIEMSLDIYKNHRKESEPVEYRKTIQSV